MASESGCPIEQHRIPVEKCDHMYDPDCEGAMYMPFHRAAYDRSTGQSPNSPREQVIICINYNIAFLFYFIFALSKWNSFPHRIYAL